MAKNDKHREVFAAEFRDRVVHHLLVRRLEPIWEPIFIFDSYACRKGKGSHGAVLRLRSFTRKATANDTRPAWFAQLDIRAFFPSIDRGILLDLVLVHEDRRSLREWVGEIDAYLRRRLKLDLHPHRKKILPVRNGIDFVGYIVRPSHLYVRRRVVQKCKTAIAAQTRNMMRKENGSSSLVFMPDAAFR